MEVILTKDKIFLSERLLVLNIFLVNKFGGWNFLYRYLKEELAIIEKNEKELNLDVAKKEIYDHSRLSHKQKIITNLLLNKQEVEDE